MFHTIFPRACWIAICGVFLTTIATHANSAPEVPNWCAEAEKSLTDKAGKPIKCKEVKKRCVQMNNYWCQKQIENNPWRGTAGLDGKDGKADGAGHALFDSVEWSARAIARDFRSKYQRGNVTALQLAEAHSPWCDTKGSLGVYGAGDKKVGRTCNDKGDKPPADFRGPFCTKPALGADRVSSCIAGCNCPPEVARKMVLGLEVNIHTDLKLFDAAGEPHPNLAVVLRNLANQEQGIFVKTEVINAGIAKLRE